MLKIHHLNQSRSERVVWLAEELGIGYELVRHQRDPQTFRSPPSLWAVSPLGKAPAIQHEGRTLIESGAIVEYMLDRWGEGRLRPPAGTPEALRYQQWMHSAESTLATPVIMGLLSAMIPDTSPHQHAFVENEYRTLFPYIEQQLGPRGHIAGAEFSAADIMVAFPLALVDGSGLDFARPSVSPLAAYPGILAYLQRLRERPAYRRALERLAG